MLLVILGALLVGAVLGRVHERALGDELARLWNLFPGNAPYVAARATKTPVVVLEPRSPGSA